MQQPLPKLTVPQWVRHILDRRPFITLGEIYNIYNNNTKFGYAYILSPFCFNLGEGKPHPEDTLKYILSLFDTEDDKNKTEILVPEWAATFLESYKSANLNRILAFYDTYLGNRFTPLNVNIGKMELYPCDPSKPFNFFLKQFKMTIVLLPVDSTGGLQRKFDDELVLELALKKYQSSLTPKNWNSNHSPTPYKRSNVVDNPDQRNTIIRSNDDDQRNTRNTIIDSDDDYENINNQEHLINNTLKRNREFNNNINFDTKRRKPEEIQENTRKSRRGVQKKKTPKRVSFKNTEEDSDDYD